MHVDAERCTYFQGSREIGADDWELIVRHGNAEGVLIDITVLLPKENSDWGSHSDWGSPIERRIRREYVETLKLVSNEGSRVEVDTESARAFDMIPPDSRSPVSIMPWSYLEDYNDQVRGTIKWSWIVPFPWL